ncbi:MAG: acylneuraminate cytidylyltransferase [Planctomycetota bacterium]
MSDRAIAIIPARGGSKGLPRKNVLPLCGKPLIAWTIEAALKAESVEGVYVSTDDAEIAAVSERYGAEVVWRPEDIAGDLASSEDALLHALESLEGEGKALSETLVFLQCTSPLTASVDIDGTVAALREQDADSAVAVIDHHYFLWKPGGEGGVVGVNHDHAGRRLLRQEREPEYLETGAVYVMSVAGFREHKRRFFGTTAAYVMPAERRLEIDEAVDFRVAEVLMRERRQRDRLALLPDPIDAVVFDFDGVFTDNRVVLSEEGLESAVCSRGDGMGIDRLRATGVPLLVLSKEPVPIVMKRCEKLKLECLHGIDDKLPALRRWLGDRGLDVSRTVYMGNDVNDYECLLAAGCGVVVADAHKDVVPVADLVLEKNGGHGAVRELCDLIVDRGGLNLRGSS